MAMFPCSIDSHRYGGKQQTVFFHVVEDGTDIGGKLRLCPGHFEMIEEFLMLKTYCVQIGGEAVEFDSDSPSPPCCECGGENPSATVFAYTFSATFPKRQFWGRVCHDCVPRTLDRVKMTT